MTFFLEMRELSQRQQKEEDDSFAEAIAFCRSTTLIRQAYTSLIIRKL